MAESTDAVKATPDTAKVETTPTTEVPAKETLVADVVKAETKAVETAKQVVPEKYDLKLTEGSLLKPADLDKIASYAKERGLSNEAAQELTHREDQAVRSFAESQRQQLLSKSQEWMKASESDAEIGGVEFKRNVELAKRVVSRFGSESLNKTLNETGLGNHPELVKLLFKIGKSMSADQLVIPGAQPSNKRSIEDVFYGATKT